MIDRASTQTLPVHDREMAGKFLAALDPKAHDKFDPLLTEKEYRAWLGISGPTAQRQRSDGSGRPFVQLSKRRVGYRKSAVERWLAARTINRVGALRSAEHARRTDEFTSTVNSAAAKTGAADSEKAKAGDQLASARKIARAKTEL